MASLTIPRLPPCSVRDRGVGRAETCAERAEDASEWTFSSEGHGLSRFQPVGREEVGCGGARVAALEWRTAGHRHHNGFASETGRHSAGRHGNDKRKSFLDVARSLMAKRYPECSGEHGRDRLVVMGTEVGGRWSAESVTFLSSLVVPRPEMQCLRCLVPPVVRHVGVRRSQGLRSVSPRGSCFRRRGQLQARQSHRCREKEGSAEPEDALTEFMRKSAGWKF